MLMIDDQLFEIEDALEEVLLQFLDLDLVKDYQKTRAVFLSDHLLQADIKAFQEANERYEEEKEYAAFRPEIKELRRQLFQQKRAIDLNSKVIAFRQSEVAVQAVLADLSRKISSAVSADIFVDTGLPLAPSKPRHEQGRGKNIRENLKKKEK